MVLSIQAKYRNGGWEAYYDNGRESSGIDVIEWAKKGQDLGAGEILLTSVDKEGTAKGMDIELIKAVTNVVTIPVIASGGVGNLNDIGLAIEEGCADAISVAHVLHYEELTINEIRQYCIEKNIPVRRLSVDGA
jgi:cyclase